MALADLDLGLRPAHPDEAGFFYTVRRDAFRPYAEQVFGPWIDAAQRAAAARDFGDLPIEIVEQRGAAIGYLVILRNLDHLWLDELALVATARSRGVGSELVRLVMARATDAGLPLRLSVLIANPAQRLYERLGFGVAHVEHPRLKMTWTPGG